MNPNRRLSAVKAQAPARRYQEAPGWAYRTEHNCVAYADAVAWLRSRGQSRWVMDPDAPKPKWMCNPIARDAQ